ncbi:MAG: rod-binding protein [Alphaproteobacteria bacterium]|nr:rod-binding protein [Alphaproteobacteria bacterium]
MSGPLSPDTTLALLQVGQSDTTKAAKSLKDAQKTKELEKVTETAREFESVFIAEMLKPMFAGTELEAPFGGGKGEEIFQGMMLQEYGKILSQTGGIGLADHVRDQMISMQAAADGVEDPALNMQQDEQDPETTETIDHDTLGGASHDE